MASGIIFGGAGSGKTVNSTLVRAEKRGKNLLLNSDNSHVVLNNFSRPNLDIEVVQNYLKNENKSNYFLGQFDSAVESKKYDNVIVDNLSDLIDLGVLDYAESPNAPKDVRQHYQMIYQQLKRLVRKAAQLDCNVIFNCWLDMELITMPDGTQAHCYKPKLPAKIMDNLCGLCNVVAYISVVTKNDKRMWAYFLESSPTLYVKDQLYCRKACKPEDLFTAPVKKVEGENV